MAVSTEKASKSKPKKGGKVLKMDSPAASNTQESPSEPDDTPPIDAQPVVDDGRVVQKPFPLPPRMTLKGGFCDPGAGMAYWRAIPEDLKSRLVVYINRELPVLNRLQECSEEDIDQMRRHIKRYPIKYIDLPPEPFGEDTDQEFLNRYGSGKYKVFVNDCGVRGAKDADLKGRNLCKFLIKVWDSDYPPILDPSRPDKGIGVLDWTHPENQSYVAELRTRGIYPPNERPGDTVAESVVSTLVDKIADLSDRVGVQETDRLVERIAQRVGNNGSAKTSEVVETIKGVKELLNPPANGNGTTVSPESSALSLATQLFTLMNTSKADNPVVEMYKLEMQELRNELKELRKQPVQQPKSIIEQLLELAPVMDKLEPLKKFLGFNGAVREIADGTERVVRASKMGTLEFLSEVLPKVFDSQIANAAAAKIMASVNGQQQTTNGQPRPQQQQQLQPGSDDEFQLWLRVAGNPALLEHFTEDRKGGELAEWVYWSRPDYLKKLQAFQHSAWPGLVGAPAIIKAYEHTPDVWKHIAGKEQAFGRFIDEFCAWQPEGEPVIEMPKAAAGDSDGWEQPERSS